MFDAKKFFLDKWGKLIQVCQDHKQKIDKDIFNLVNDVNLMVNCTNYTNILKPIAKALDKMQKDQTKIAHCVEIWINSRDELKGIKEVKNKINKERNGSFTSTFSCEYVGSSILWKKISWKTKADCIWFFGILQA